MNQTLFDKIKNIVNHWIDNDETSANIADEIVSGIKFPLNRSNIDLTMYERTKRHARFSFEFDSQNKHPFVIWFPHETELRMVLGMHEYETIKDDEGHLHISEEWDNDVKYVFATFAMTITDIGKPSNINKLPMWIKWSDGIIITRDECDFQSVENGFERKSPWLKKWMQMGWVWRLLWLKI